MQPGVRAPTRRAANSCLVRGLGLDLFFFPPVLRIEPGTLDIRGLAFCCHSPFVPQGTYLKGGVQLTGVSGLGNDSHACSGEIH